MRIHILDDATINQIAAGEVIERPASALKELLENSADSGATRIEVDFEAGGKSYLKVLDDGCGMSFDELPIALQRHTTSKIKSIEDLQRLKTFGFRGEALASIAAVSELNLISSQKDSKQGSEVTAVGGQVDGPKPSAPINGTQITIKNLFFNVPARQKFLKSDAGETAAIKKSVRAFALCHPELSITLKQNGRILAHWNQEKFFDRACHVLELNPQLCRLHEASLETMSLKAVVGLPEAHLATTQGIWIQVQGRPIMDRTLQAAIMEGYRNLIMHHQFPQIVLSLNTSASDVDVNVHPTKAQVRFANPSAVFRFVNHEIKKCLEESLFKGQREESQVYHSYQSSVHTSVQAPLEQVSLISESKAQYNVRSFSNPEVKKVESQPEVAVGPWSSLQVIGQFANTYIVTQSHQGLILIDQHASHERVLFERLKRNHREKKTEKQMALLEEVIEMDSQAIEALASPIATSIFEAVGFEISQRGPNHINVHARPSFLLDIGLRTLFERLAEQIHSAGDSGVLEDVLTDIWASMSCHGAIRAGRVLSESEMQSLLKQMDEFTFSSFCPHGRPVSVKLTLSEIEKLFKRIV